MASVVVEASVPIPMRDGVRLFADIHGPSLSRNTQCSSSVVRTIRAWGRTQFLYAVRAAEQGYAVVIQDTRGRRSSEGEFAS